MSKIKQTAGKDALGDFAPEFARFNDDILFGENWNNQDINLKTRCIITVVTLSLLGTGYTSAKLGQAPIKNAMIRNLTIGLLTMTVTYLVGQLFSI